ncbi:hypothetical protein DFQ05_0246 [Winogradskyella wandonensis]|uniref:Uncharacterized protein n=1 Tax=Winogradskyella wandonensis TaxID=1442586 RepID=A0A4R1KU53_9FLAO|nr:hypothetical protein [Winogradskyella wandonensis]TCK68736.1 hypothetical protein DFQ05_0246 [Winogradskyella wandonensis]
MKQYTLLYKTWTSIGFILTIIGMLSLFGNLPEITFGEFIQRFISSYRSIIYPVLDFLNFNKSNLFKDIFSAFFFLFSFSMSSLMEIKVFNNKEFIIKLEKEKKSILSFRIITYLFQSFVIIIICYFISWLILNNNDNVSVEIKKIMLLCLCTLLLFQFAIFLMIPLLTIVNTKIGIVLSKFLYIIFRKLKYLKFIIYARKAQFSSLTEFKSGIADYTKITIKTLSVFLIVLLILGLNHYFRL